MAVPTKEQLLRGVKLEPASAEELAWAEQLGAGEYEIYSEKLYNITQEAAEVFSRLGVTAGIRGCDNIVAIYTPAGDMVCAWTGTYIHAVTAQLPIKYIMREFRNDPTVGVNDGDVFYASDPAYGGIHNPDQLAFMPIFHNGEIVAWCCSGAHEGESGGTDPGGLCPNARTRYDEGMKLSPIKIGENFVIKNDLEEMICNMIGRAIRMQRLDIKARVTACDRVRIRLQEILNAKGREFVIGLFRKMIMTAEQGARNRVKGWNDGIYRCVVFGDGTGPREKGIFRIFLTLYKEGENLRFDFRGTSPNLGCYLNLFAHATIAHAAHYLYGRPFWNLPVSAGTMNLMDWVIEEGTVLDSDFEAPQSANPGMGLMAINPIAGCFSRMMFDSDDRDLVGMNVACGVNIQQIAGVNPWAETKWGELVSDSSSFTLNTLGVGAGPSKDGLDAGSMGHAYIGRACDMEFDENMFPVLTLFRGYVKDSGGFGKYRGGVASGVAVTPYPGDYVLFTSVGISERLTIGQGLFGGYPARITPVTIIEDSDIWELLSKSEDIPIELSELVTKRQIKGKYIFTYNNLPTMVLRKGSVAATASGGGAGYGDVLEREPELVMKDLKEGFITDWVVENVFHVAYDPETLTADKEKTAELRQKERERRLQRGKNYEEFMQEWLQKKPPEDCLITYGTWPDAKPVRTMTWA